MRYLLAEDADPFLVDRAHLRTALHSAAAYGHAGVLRVLLRDDLTVSAGGQRLPLRSARVRDMSGICRSCSASTQARSPPSLPPPRGGAPPLGNQFSTSDRITLESLLSTHLLDTAASHTVDEFRHSLQFCPPVVNLSLFSSSHRLCRRCVKSCSPACGVENAMYLVALCLDRSGLDIKS